MSKKEELLVDIGNSTAVFARFDGTALLEQKRVATSDIDRTFLDDALSASSRVFVSSVVPSIDAMLSHYNHVVFIQSESIPLLTVNVEIPAQVGADRLVNALGAYQLYKRDCLIVDSGTAITFCYVDKEGVYHGGSIFPGMGIASKALSLYTAKIPLIHVKPQETSLGKTTQEAVEVGLYHGYVHMINGMIDQIRRDIPNIFVVGAGSGLKVLEDKLHIDEYNPDLTLQGLSVCSQNWDNRIT
jgi:type III pantothenate kinase